MPKQPRKSSLRLSVPPPGMLGFAEGGIIKETPAQLMARIDAKYGTGKAADPAPVQQPAPQPQAQQTPQQQSTGAGIVGILKGRQQQIDKAAGYAYGGVPSEDENLGIEGMSLKAGVQPGTFGNPIADFAPTATNDMSPSNRPQNPHTGYGTSTDLTPQPQNPQNKQPGIVPGGFGTTISGLGVAVRNQQKNRRKSLLDELGFANGGKIEGPGTPTSDSIPAQVVETGEPIKVSTGERIVSADQGRFLEAVAKNAGYKSLDVMLEDGTGKPVGPAIKGGKRAAEDGKPPELDPFAYRGPAVEDPKRVAVAIAAPPTLGGAPLARTEPAGGALSGPASGITAFGPAGSGLTIDPSKPSPDTDTMIPRPGSRQSATPVSLPRPGSGRDANGTITADSAASAYSPEASRTNLGTMNLAEQNERMAKSLGYAGTDDFNKQWRLRRDPEEQQADRAANGSPDAALRAATIRRGQDMRAETAADRMDSNEYIAGERIAERAGRTDKPKAPTLAQDRTNLEIDAARERIAGMDPAEIKRRTANFTATGRENPDYDEGIARAAKLANRRKVGDDQHFDERQQRTASQHGYERNEVASRFRAERDMAAYKLGNDTPNGVEVLDASGKIIGHYR